MQVLSISTYDYLRNTSLHYIYELELVPIPLGYGYHMMNIIQQITDPMPMNFYRIVSAKLLLAGDITTGYDLPRRGRVMPLAA